MSANTDRAHIAISFHIGAAPVHSSRDLLPHAIHFDGRDSLGATVSDRDRCVGLETYLQDGQVEASSEASGSSSYEEAT